MLKRFEHLLSVCVVFVFLGNISGQEIIRTPFLQIGDAPFRQNITKNEGDGFSMYTLSTETLDDAVAHEVKTQKAAGFISVDKANLLFGVMRTLDSEYPVKKGMIYRIVAITTKQKETFIFRVVNDYGSLVVPEIQTPGDYRNGILHTQLEDYAPSKNGNIRLQNITLSTDKNYYSAVCYLILKKKVK